VSGILAERRGIVAKPTTTTGTPAAVGTPGTSVASAASVLDPTTLTPGTGTGYAIGDLLLCFTACRAVTPTCATPSGWTKLGEYDGTAVGIIHGYLFGFIADSTSVAAPSVVWSGLTTGSSGSPVVAQCAAFTHAGITVDVFGALGATGGSTTASGGGAAITTTVDKDLLLKLSARADDIADTWSASGWTNVSGGAGAGAAMFTTSGSDVAAHWAWMVKTPAGSSGVLNFTISGGTITSQSSAGAQVALKAV
jgi:hypothetical protein